MGFRKKKKGGGNYRHMILHCNALFLKRIEKKMGKTLLSEIKAFKSKGKRGGDTSHRTIARTD